MAGLSIRHVAIVEVRLDGERLTPFATSITHTLPAHAAAGSDSPQSCKALAEMLGSDRREGAARASRRHSLHAPCLAIRDCDSGPPLLLASPYAIWFHGSRRYWRESPLFAIPYHSTNRFSCLVFERGSAGSRRLGKQPCHGPRPVSTRAVQGDADGASPGVDSGLRSMRQQTG